MFTLWVYLITSFIEVGSYTTADECAVALKMAKEKNPSSTYVCVELYKNPNRIEVEP